MAISLLSIACTVLCRWAAPYLGGDGAARLPLEIKDQFPAYFLCSIILKDAGGDRINRNIGLESQCCLMQQVC